MSFRKKGGASMYMYEATELITINTTNVYHAVTGFSAGSVNSAATFTASATGSITDTADNGSGVLRCTDVGHGLTTGQFITLNGMGDAAHNGITEVTVIDADTFDAEDITYNSDNDTGEWQRGSSLTIKSGFGGSFNGGFSVTAAAAAANKNFKFEIYGGTTAFDEFAVEALFPNSNYNNVGSSGIGNLPAGTVMWMAVKNTTDSGNITVEHANLNMKK